LDERRNGLGRMLQIAIHDHGGGAYRIAQARSNGDFLAKITAEYDGLESRIACVERHEHRRGAIFRPVVDEDDFPWPPETTKRRDESIQQARQAALFVEHGNDD